ncbi:MAG: hypothetical protein HY848_19515 [Betaproteobacteria bacterium]|nr:hypothetical protein [Betaproteobacteria bacterium]
MSGIGQRGTPRAEFRAATIFSRPLSGSSTYLLSWCATTATFDECRAETWGNGGVTTAVPGDENFPRPVIEGLIAAGFDELSLARHLPGINDRDVSC